MLVLYVLLMYIGAYPIVMSMRRSDKSKDTLAHQYQDDTESETAQRTSHGIRLGGPIQHKYLRSVLKAVSWWAQTLMLRDITWLFVAWFSISAIESDKLTNDPNFSAMKVVSFNTNYFVITATIFELTSAYGTVGLSMGYPGVYHSFSGVLSTGSKLMIIWIMMLGRCRGLPDSKDYAVDVKKYSIVEPITESKTKPDTIRIETRDENR
jgi:Trk-type K+ transport system membrane component